MVYIKKTPTNLWTFFHCRVKRQHYERYIGIGEYSELPDCDCVMNPFPTDTVNIYKNITLLDVVYDEEPVTDFCCIIFSNTTYRDT